MRTEPDGRTRHEKGDTVTNKRERFRDVMEGLLRAAYRAGALDEAAELYPNEALYFASHWVRQSANVEQDYEDGVCPPTQADGLAELLASFAVAFARRRAEPVEP